MSAKEMKTKEIRGQGREETNVYETAKSLIIEMAIRKGVQKK